MEKGKQECQNGKTICQNSKMFIKTGKKVIIAPFLGVFALVNSFIVHYKGAVFRRFYKK